jgi:endonuclease YncB( thermonuclease family)
MYIINQKNINKWLLKNGLVNFYILVILNFIYIFNRVRNFKKLE